MQEDTVDDEFEEIKQWIFVSHIAWIFDAVDTNNNASVIGILFFGTERAHNFRVCGLFPAVSGYVVVIDNVECVCAFDPLGVFFGDGTDALVETTEFISRRRVPYWY